jgi:hypothetical protein
MQNKIRKAFQTEFTECTILLPKFKVLKMYYYYYYYYY